MVGHWIITLWNFCWRNGTNLDSIASETKFATFRAGNKISSRLHFYLSDLSVPVSDRFLRNFAADRFDLGWTRRIAQTQLSSESSVQHGASEPCNLPDPDHLKSQVLLNGLVFECSHLTNLPAL